jgi:hypothetical protein
MPASTPIAISERTTFKNNVELRIIVHTSMSVRYSYLST